MKLSNQSKQVETINNKELVYSILPTSELWNPQTKQHKQLNNK